MEMTVQFAAPARVLYEALTEERFGLHREYIRFTRAPATFDKAGKFSLYEGGVHGSVLELVLLTQEPPTRIKLSWAMKNWPAFSTVEIRLRDLEDNECELKLTQTNIPPQDSLRNPIDPRDVERGWRGMVFQNISNILGYTLIS